MKRFALLTTLALLVITGMALAQQPTDSSTQASPTSAPPSTRAIDSAKSSATDTAAEASPALGTKPARSSPSLVSGTAIPIKLTHAIDSGRLKNGQTIPATLMAPLHTSFGTTLQPGTPVDVTVIATVPAGKLIAVGEFSLQVLRIGTVAPYTDTLTFRGKPGHRDVADAAPALGTDAGLPAGAHLIFHQLKPPTAATSAPRNAASTPGSVNGIASGSAPPNTSHTSATSGPKAP